MHKTLEKLAKIFEDNLEAKDKFEEIIWEICDSSDKEDFYGIEIQGVCCGRDEGSGDFDGYTWVFKLDGDLFKVVGSYSSWNGSDMDFGGVDDIKSCKKVERTVVDYEEV